MNPEISPCETCSCVDGDAGFYRWQFLGEPVFRDESGEPTGVSSICPRTMVTDDSSHLLSLFGHYKAGHLMNAGGISDQPALYMDAMRVIDGAIAQARKNAG